MKRTDPILLFVLVGIWGALFFLMSYWALALLPIFALVVYNPLRIAHLVYAIAFGAFGWLVGTIAGAVIGGGPFGPTGFTQPRTYLLAVTLVLMAYPVARTFKLDRNEKPFWIYSGIQVGVVGGMIATFYGIN